MRADRVLAVATSLNALGSDALRRILTERAVSVTTDSHPLDIAQQVVEPEAVTNQLGYLTADDIARLQGALSTADSSGLIEDDAARLLADGPGQSVSVEVADALADIPDPSSAPSPQSVPAAVDAVAVGAALEKIETLLAVLSTRPVPGPGVSSLEDWAMTHGDEPELWREASGVCRSVGLVVLRHGVWELTEQARTWTAGSLSERWAWLAEALWAIRPGWLDATSAPTRDHTTGWFQAAQTVGVIQGGTPTELAYALEAGTAPQEAVASFLPEPVTQVYVDGPDTLVTAGPLPVAAERGLRRIGAWVSGSVASRFRITPQTVLSARQHGATTDDIAEVINQSVPGGIESALGVSVMDTLERAEKLRLRWSEAGTVLQCEDELTRELLRADRKLAPLQLQATAGPTLTSAHPVDQVHSLLVAEGYPHLVENQSGELFDVDSSPIAPEGDSPTEHDGSSDLPTAWRARQSSDPATWWSPFFDWAIAHKLRLDVEVDIGGQHSRFVIEPKSIQNGRLRARDTRSDVERTIPVSHVLEIYSPEVISPES